MDDTTILKMTAVWLVVVGKVEDCMCVDRCGGGRGHSTCACSDGSNNWSGRVLWGI